MSRKMAYIERGKVPTLFDKYVGKPITKQLKKEIAADATDAISYALSQNDANAIRGAFRTWTGVRL